MKPTLYQKTKWLRFYIVAKKPKTLVLNVINIRNQFLGEIHWNGSFRQYSYESEPKVDYNDRCLRDIADVCTSLNAEHKKKQKKEND